jgi:molybdate transport system substrate-binding protein
VLKSFACRCTRRRLGLPLVKFSIATAVLAVVAGFIAPLLPRALLVAYPSPAAANGAEPAGTLGDRRSVLILAAASTSNAIEEIRQQFTKDTGIEVQASYAASSTLAQQVVHGAAADVFISADLKWADFLDKKEQIARRQNRLGNRLVIVVLRESSLHLTTPEDLATAAVEHLALGDPESVPAGRYAKQALIKLGVWERLQGKIVPAEDVRHALAYVETGNAQAGIVYSTDVAISKRVRVVASIPAGLTEPICYPFALLKHGEGRPNAEAFYACLLSPAAGKVFEKYGFAVLGPPDSKPAK